MRTSVTSLTKKFISTFFAATLALGLVPAVAFAVDESPEDESSQYVISSEGDAVPEVEKSAPIEQNEAEGLTNSFGESNTMDDATGSEDAMSIPAATERINQDMVLQTRTVAQAESTRSYFLAQTLESTRTVPIVSASLPLDTGSTDVVDKDSEASEDEGGEDSDESDPGIAPIAASSTVVGSFTYLGMTFAVEPGGESVALVAVDYKKLPEEFTRNQMIALPAVATNDGIDFYTVSRIADYAFSSMRPEESEGFVAVAIPASVVEIGADAFTNFDTLLYIIVPEDNPVYSQYDGCLYDADQTSLLLIPEGRTGAVCIAPSAETVTSEVFSHCPLVDTVCADADSAAYAALEEMISSIDTPLNLVADAVSQRPELDRLRELAKSLDENFASLEGRNVEMFSVRNTENATTAAPAGWAGASYYFVDGATPESHESYPLLHACVDEGTPGYKLLPDAQYAEQSWATEEIGGITWRPMVDWDTSMFGSEDTKNLKQLMYWLYEKEDPAYGKFIYRNQYTQMVGARYHCGIVKGWNGTGFVDLPETWRKDKVSVFFFPGNATFAANNDGTVGKIPSYKILDAASSSVGENITRVSLPEVSIAKENWTFYGWILSVKRMDGTGTVKSLSIPASSTITAAGGIWEIPSEYMAYRTYDYLWEFTANFQESFTVTWNVSKFGGVGASCAKDGNNTPAGVENVDGSSDLREHIMVTNKVKRTGVVRFPIANNKLSDGSQKVVRFLGWTNDPDGGLPISSSGVRETKYFTYTDAQFIVSATQLTKLKDDEITFSFDVKIPNSVWYGVWESQLDFNAASYGGTITGVNSSWADATDKVWVKNNQPISATFDMPARLGATTGAFAPSVADVAGWTFIGWTTTANPNRSGDALGGDVARANDIPNLIRPNTSFTPDGSATYYAVWECRVSWGKVEGSPTSATIAPSVATSYLYGYNVKAPEVLSSPISHVFCGWSDALGNEAAVVQNSAKTEYYYAVRTAGKVLASWTPATFDVDLLASNYDGFVYGADYQEMVHDESRTKTIRVTYGEPISQDGIWKPEMRGYVFLGYFDIPQTVAASSPDASSYAPSDAVRFYDEEGEPEADLKWMSTDSSALYAHYYRISYMLSFDANADGAVTSDGLSSIPVYYGMLMTDAPSADRVLHRDGFSFGGWEDDQGQLYFDSLGQGVLDKRFLLEEDVTLKAVWNPHTYTIKWTFNYDYTSGGDNYSWSHNTDCTLGVLTAGSYTMTDVTYGKSITIPQPVSKAFDFTGWYTGKPDAVFADKDHLAIGDCLKQEGDKYLFMPDDSAGATDIELFAGWGAMPCRWKIILSAGEHEGYFDNYPNPTKTLENFWTGDKNDDWDLMLPMNVPSVHAPGWVFDHWVETTDDPEGVVVTDTVIPRGSGTRSFCAVWRPGDEDYSATFNKGSEVARTVLGYDTVIMDDNASPRFTAATERVVLPRLNRTETLGYVFDGWYRADDQGKIITPLEKLEVRTYTGQELVNIAAKVPTHNLYYVARWMPKTFEVRYVYDTNAAEQVMDGATQTLAYTDSITLADPSFYQLGATGRIFSGWTGVGGEERAVLSPGATMTLRELIYNALEEPSVDQNQSIVRIRAKWVPAISFTVPLTVNVLIDPDYPEKTEPVNGWIETDSAAEVTVESLAFVRSAKTSFALMARGDDRSDSVNLVIEGDSPIDGGGTSSPLKVTLGESRVYRDLANSGLGKVSSAKRMNVSYILERDESKGCPPWTAFENLTDRTNFQDRYDTNGDHLAYELGRVHYTIALK